MKKFYLPMLLLTTLTVTVQEAQAMHHFNLITAAAMTTTALAVGGVIFYRTLKNSKPYLEEKIVSQTPIIQNQPVYSEFDSLFEQLKIDLNPHAINAIEVLINQCKEECEAIIYEFNPTIHPLDIDSVQVFINNLQVECESITYAFTQEVRAA